MLSTFSNSVAWWPVGEQAIHLGETSRFTLLFEGVLREAPADNLGERKQGNHDHATWSENDDFHGGRATAVA